MPPTVYERSSAQAVRFAWLPWTNARALEACALAYLVTLHVVTWLLEGIGTTNDSFGYVQGVALLRSGAVSYYPPGYPIFLAPWVTLFPHSTGLAVAGAQHLCMLASLLALLPIVRAFLGDRLAVVALVLAGSAGPTLFLPQMILSENVSLLGMTGGLWLAARPGARPAFARELAAGVLIGWATLTRALPLAVMILPVLLSQLSTRNLRASSGSTARIFSMAIATVLLVMSWNFWKSGDFSISHSQSFHLYNRVVREQGLLDPHGPATREFLDRMDHRPLKGIPHWEISAVLEGDGLTGKETRQLLGAVAIEGLRANMLAFARYSLSLAWRESRAAPALQLVGYSERPMEAFDRGVSMATDARSWQWWHFFTAAFATLWPILLWAPLVGLLMLPFLKERWVFLAVFGVPAGYLFATAQLSSFADRHIAGVLPFALMLVPAPVAALRNLWRSRARLSAEHDAAGASSLAR